MALPQARQSAEKIDVSMPPRPTVTRPVDLKDAAIGAHHYREPEVNRLKEWAMQATIETAEENMLNAQIQALSPGVAIGLMVTVSVALWGLMAAGIALIF